MRRCVVTGLALAGACVAQAQVSVSGTFETYFMTRNDVGGFGHRLTWGELNVRFNSNLKATVSMTESPTSDSLDEAYVAAESDFGILRVGRIRTAFGLSDWSELFYNGFNHIPMVMINTLAPGVRLMRDDTGAEGTFSVGQTQFQVAVVDTQSAKYQWSPKELRHASLRAQQSILGALVGFDVLKSFDATKDVYGLDVRWGFPHFLVKGEAMQGQGADNAMGYSLDVAYRPPRLSRTQVVARTERLNRPSRGDFSLHTVGVRQILDKYLSVNVNYGWSRASNSTFRPGSSLTGWSVQAMFQVRF